MAWTQKGSLKGPKGDPGQDGQNGRDGVDGAPGKDGAKGADGATIITGDAAPTEEQGKVGDIYISTDGTWYQKE